MTNEEFESACTLAKTTLENTGNGFVKTVAMPTWTMNVYELQNICQALLHADAQLKAKDAEIVDLRELGAQHIKSIFSMFSTFPEIDFAKKMAEEHDLYDWDDTKFPRESKYREASDQLKTIEEQANALAEAQTHILHLMGCEADGEILGSPYTYAQAVSNAQDWLAKWGKKK